MNPEIKTKWVEALRSGKYKQGTEHFKRDGCYCVLGVLYEVAGCQWRELDGDLQPFYMEHEYIASIDLVFHEHIGLDPTNPRLEISGAIVNLISLNDAQGYDFNQMADLIEAQL